MSLVLHRAALVGLLGTLLLIAGGAGAMAKTAREVPATPMFGLDQEFSSSDAFDVLDAALPDDHPSVRGLLAADPDRRLMICLAGCGREAKLVVARAAMPDDRIEPARLAPVTQPSAPAALPASADGVPGLEAFPRIETRFGWTNPSLALTLGAGPQAPQAATGPTAPPVAPRAAPAPTASTSDAPSRAELRRMRDAERRL